MFKRKTVRKVHRNRQAETRDPLIFHYGDPVTTSLAQELEDRRRRLSQWHPLQAPFPSD